MNETYLKSKQIFLNYFLYINCIRYYNNTIFQKCIISKLFTFTLHTKNADTSEKYVVYDL